MTGDLTGNADTADQVNNNFDVAVTGNGLSVNANSFNGSANVTATVNSNATSANLPDTIVYRNSSNSFNATQVNANLVGNVTGDVTGNLNGVALSAQQLNPGNTINGVLFDGTQPITITARTAGNLTLDTSGVGLSGGPVTYDGTTASFTVTSNATSADSTNTIVSRDGAGGFTGQSITALNGFTGNLLGNVTGNLLGDVTGNVTGDVTGDLTGNADTATDATNTQNIRVDDDSSSVSEQFLLFSGGATGQQRAKSDGGLLYNPSLNRVTATSFQGTFSGNATTASQLNVQNNTSPTNYPFVFALDPAAGNKALFTDSLATCFINPGNNSIGASLFIGALQGNATSSTTATTANALNTANSYQVNSFGVGTAPSGTAGEIRATNDITAFFSDIRLKQNLKKIERPLDKVCQLRGVLYEPNALAVTHGFQQEEMVGVIAQEVEKVLPQAVKPAPFDTYFDNEGASHSISGEDYKTVKYEKLVPLLIEAIKELKAEVDELRGKL